MQGNCTAAPPAALLSAADSEVWLPGQCVIVVDYHLFAVKYSALWLDQLFVSLHVTSRTGLLSTPAMISVGFEPSSSGNKPSAGLLWLTRSVVSADADAGEDSGPRRPVTAVAVHLDSFAGLHGVPQQN